MESFRWKPLEPLSTAERSIDLSATRPLYETWYAASAALRQSSADGLKQFTDKLVRRLAIETGILEGLYDIDRGTTEALVAAGFSEDLVSRSSTDVEPRHLIDVLEAQEAAIHLVMDCVSKSRPLTKGVLLELHAILTRHQETTVAVDQFGKRFEVPLARGQFKKLPNNPARPDGVIHEYCPPEQVDSEVESLLSLLQSYESEDPVIVAAWAHHRFTQVHPFQDGNGRVARALTTLILLKADLLPLVVDRDMRSDYIEALEASDKGELAPLANFFARLERTAILQALSIDVDSEVRAEKKLSAAVIESLAGKFDRRKQAAQVELRKVDSLAASLRAHSRRSVQQTFNALASTVAFIGTPEIRIADGGPDRQNAHWYKFDVVRSGEATGKFINFDEAHYFLKASFRVGRERLVLVVSFHHVGRDLTGIVEATAFARLESFEGSDDRDSVADEFSTCSLEPFVITWRTTEGEVTASFERWLDAAIAVAVKDFGDRL